MPALPDALQTFSFLVTSVFLEAAPFLMLGSLLSAILEIYVSPEAIQRWMPRGTFMGILFGLSAGMVLPTCECGVVPIARRLITKGVPSHTALTYMLAAPVINPVVLLSTYVAFRGNLWMVGARVALVAACALCIGLATTGIAPGVLLRRGGGPVPVSGGDVHPDHSHGHDPVCGHAHNHNHEHEHDIACACGCAPPGWNQRGFFAVFRHAASEFLGMGKYLILGAFAVGIFRTAVPPEIMTPFEDNPFLAVGAMMLLAIVLSVCSEADAFVANSFINFPDAAQLSFVAIGPMVDLKLILMFAAVFHPRITMVLILAPVIIVYMVSAFLAYIPG